MDFDVTSKVNGERVEEPQQQGKDAEGTRGDLFKEYYMRKRNSGSMWSAKKQRRQIEAEQRIRAKRYEEYVKMLRASSLKRKLQEQEMDKRYEQDSVARNVALSAYGVEFIKKYSGFF